MRVQLKIRKQHMNRLLVCKTGAQSTADVVSKMAHKKTGDVHAISLDSVANAENKIHTSSTIVCCQAFTHSCLQPRTDINFERHFELKESLFPEGP